MKRFFKSLTMYSLVALFAMGMTSSQAVEAATSTTITKTDLINGLGIARDFGIVARTWEQNDHLETSVCVEKAILANRAFTNTDRVYRTNMSYTATISKTGNVSDAQTFNIALFTKGTDGKYTMVANSIKQISRAKPVTYDLRQFTSSTEQGFYLFELDESDQPIANNTKGGGYTVTYSTATNGINLPNANLITALNNTSYIKTFTGNDDTPFNGDNNGGIRPSNPYIVFGSDVTFVQDINKHWKATTNGNNSIYLEDGNAEGPTYATRVAKEEDYPIKFDSLFSELNAFSKKLALLDATTEAENPEVRVINLTAAQETGTSKATVGKQAWDGCHNLYTSETVGTNGLVSLKINNTGWQYLVINVKVPAGVTSLSVNSQLTINGSQGDDFEAKDNTLASRILYNFVNEDGTPYSGSTDESADDITIAADALMGTFLAPSANVHMTAGSSSSAYIAKKFTNDHEIHYIPFGVGAASNTKASISNADGTAPIPTELSLSASKTVDGNTPSANEVFDFTLKSTSKPVTAYAIKDQTKQKFWWIYPI